LLKLNFREFIGATICSLSSFCLYLLTIAPSVQGFDSAELTVGAYDLGFIHPPGYPLYLIIGHLFTKIPLANVGFRVNLMSAFFASLSCFVLFILLIRQTGNFPAAFVSTILLATSPAYWSQSIRAEVYTLHVFIITCALFVFYQALKEQSQKGYLLFYLLLGFGLGNHPTTILLWFSALISTIWLPGKLRKLTIPANLTAITLVGFQYLYFPWRSNANLEVDYIRPYFNIDPGSLSGVLWIFSGRIFHCLFIPDGNLGLHLTQVFTRLFEFLWLGTLGFGLLLALIGWFTLRKQHKIWNRMLTLYFLANVCMFMAYGAIDKEVMFLPLFIVICIWIANGINTFTDWISRSTKFDDRKTSNFFISAILLLLIISAMLLDWKSVSLHDDRRIYDYTRQILDNAKPGATIVNHWVTASVFDYLQIVEGRRPDVSIINIDFYFLGLQRGCQSITNKDLIMAGWIPWLHKTSVQGKLCFIEPLHDVPRYYKWVKKDDCWELHAQAPYK